jgi:hypothetical protein
MCRIENLEAGMLLILMINAWVMCGIDVASIMTEYFIVQTNNTEVETLSVIGSVIKTRLQYSQY